MYICICNGITERDLHNCIRQGACCMDDLRRELGIGTQCGRCETHARLCLRKTAETGVAEPVSA
ncbi:MAG: hypothetical protein A3I01_19940 [Betaproteobacteria bacterium RIFCSPLOWO2_02_FULL_65_24]|nr:MAG: hypothetical protein A3I01_19940 [Betaproteobacteria bacterium RIFCSPLOWO2_02_FULL_65_24]